MENIKKHLSSIDGLRAVGAVLVFNLHFLIDYANYSTFENPIIVGIIKFLQSGHIGVDLFFVLSGFLIFRSLLKNQYSFVDFIKFRFKRLLPANFFVLSILTFNNFAIIGFILNLFFIVPLLQNVPQYNYVAWTLNWELLFYLIIFYIFIIYKRFKFKYFFRILITTALVTSAMFVILDSTNSLTLPEPGRFASFFFGAVIAYLEFKKFQYNKKWMTIGAIISSITIVLAMIVWANKIPIVTTNSFFLIVGLCFSCIVAYVINFESFLNKILDSGLFKNVGKVSYSFYLIHPLIMPLALRELNEKGINILPINYLVAFGACYFFSLFMYTYLERPYFQAKVQTSQPKDLLSA